MNIEALNIQTLTVGPNAINCYIVSLEDRADAVIIDPGDEEETIRAALQGREIAAVLLTHGHCDHTNALYGFAGVPIVIHPADEIMLRDSDWSLAAPMGLDTREKPPATVFVQEGSRLQYAGLEITVMHLPGHTLGSVAYRIGDALFTGDTLFHRGYGRTDFPGGNFGQLRQSLRRLLKMEENLRVYPGHGEATWIFEERGY